MDQNSRTLHQPPITSCDPTSSSLSSWFLNPPSQVGDRTTSLPLYPRGTDTIGLVGCRSQLYTAWASLPHSYLVSSVMYSDVVEPDPPTLPLAHQPILRSPADIGESTLTRADIRMIREGKKFIFPGQDRPLTLIQAKTRAIITPDSTPSNWAFTVAYVLDVATSILSWKTSSSVVAGSGTFNAFRTAHPAEAAALDILWSRAILISPRWRCYSRDSSTVFAKLKDLPATTTAGEFVALASGVDVAPRSSAERVPRHYGMFADVVPVQVCEVSTAPTSLDLDPEGHFAPMMAQFKSRLTDSTQVGTLGSLVRGVNIGDGAATLNLAKLGMLYGGTLLEVAPLLRLACMVASVDVGVASTDPTIYMWMRGLTSLVYESSYIKAAVVGGSGILAMPYDTFIGFITGVNREGLPAGFEAEGADKVWTAVPITSEVIGRDMVVPYLCSFLSSRYWEGSVTHYYTAEYEYSTPGIASCRAGHRLMPACNSVRIPGATSLIVVLVDVTASNANTTVSVGGAFVPVWNGRTIPPVNIPQFGAIWSGFWTHTNLSLATAITDAENYIAPRLCVGGTNGLAKSLAAELYGAWRPGFMVDHFAGAYDTDTSAHGAWKMHPYENTTTDEPLDRNSEVKCALIRLVDQTVWSPAQLSRIVSGFNFASLSSTHGGRSSLVGLMTDGPDLPLRCYWNGLELTYYSPVMKAPTLGSNIRLAVFVGLFSTYSPPTKFGHGGGFAAWIHQQACALGFATASHLANANVTVSAWSGFDNTLDSNLRSDEVAGMKKKIFREFIMHKQLKQTFDSYTDWDPTCIEEYYDMDPFYKYDWYSCSPVPMAMTLMWQKKVDIGRDGAPPREELTVIGGRTVRALALDPQVMGKKILIAGTTDWERYRPSVECTTGLIRQGAYGAWLEQDSAISLLASGASRNPPRSHLASKTITISAINSGLGFMKLDDIYVLNSMRQGRNDPMYEPRMSMLQYPDPPTRDDRPKNDGGGGMDRDRVVPAETPSPVETLQGGETPGQANL